MIRRAALEFPPEIAGRTEAASCIRLHVGRLDADGHRKLARVLLEIGGGFNEPSGDPGIGSCLRHFEQRCGCLGRVKTALTHGY